MQTSGCIREPVAAGTFYPAGFRRLQKRVQQLLANCCSEVVQEEIVGMICPHAGYRYSGGVAAEAYHQLRNRSCDIVVILAPSHFQRFSACHVYDGSFRTPLGEVPPAADLIAALCANSALIRPAAEGHIADHAVEVQLPFLQTVLPPFRLAAISIGPTGTAVSKALCNALLDAIDLPDFRSRRILVIASSDLSHYHPAPVAERMDRRVLEHLAALDAEGLQADFAAGRCEACGEAAILTLLHLAKRRGARHSRILAYTHSGEINHDRQRVVGYTATVFY